MELNLRPREECRFDAVSLGEIMLRLDPGEGRIRTARSFRAWEGGGEYNVIRGLHKCFGMDTAVITAFADNEVGRLMKDFIEQGGVSTDLIYWKKTDGRYRPHLPQRHQLHRARLRHPGRRGLLRPGQHRHLPGHARGF